jgi:hypothetical protein
MAIVVVMVLVGLVVVGVAIMLALRTWVLEESRTEARLHRPGAHTLSYVVPNGQDPAVLMAAVRNAGLTSVVDTTGGTERILVECEEEDRARVRSALEHAAVPGYDGHTTVAHVAFEDER